MSDSSVQLDERELLLRFARSCVWSDYFGVGGWADLPGHERLDEHEKRFLTREGFAAEHPFTVDGSKSVLIPTRMGIERALDLARADGGRVRPGDGLVDAPVMVARLRLLDVDEEPVFVVLAGCGIVGLGWWWEALGVARGDWSSVILNWPLYAVPGWGLESAPDGDEWVVARWSALGSEALLRFQDPLAGSLHLGLSTDRAAVWLRVMANVLGTPPLTLSELFEAFALGWLASVVEVEDVAWLDEVRAVVERTRSGPVVGS